MLGELSALGAAILWSISPFVFTTIVQSIGSFQLNLWRLFLAGLFLMITFLVFKINFSINAIQIFYLSVSGLIGLVFGDTYLFKSFREIGPRYTMIIMSSNPILGAILAYFVFSEKIQPIGVLGMIITIAGIIIVINQQSDKEISAFKITKKGIVYGFFAALGQAVGLIFTKAAFYEGEINPLLATFFRIESSFVILLIIGFFYQKFNKENLAFVANKKTISLLVLGSLIGPYLGITLSYIAVVNIPVGIASTIMSFQPILMLPISKLYFKEKLSVQSIFGAILAVSGLILLFVRTGFY